MKVYVPFGTNNLINAVGPAGVFRTREGAEKSGDENLDKGFKVVEYELED